MKHPSSVKAFGVRLRQIREDRGLTQQELADLSDMARGTITRFENGQMNSTLDGLVSIAKGLEMPMSELMDFSFPKEKPTKPSAKKKA